MAKNECETLQLKSSDGQILEVEKAVSLMSETMKLKSSDGQILEVEKAVALMSETIKTMLETNQTNENIIPLFNVEGRILEKVIQYCKYHIHDDQDFTRREDDIQKWDEDFFNVEQDDLFDIILAANYLNLKDLLDLGCQTVANAMKDKTIEQIRETFNIKNDYTREEMEEVKRQHAWAFK